MPNIFERRSAGAPERGSNPMRQQSAVTPALMRSCPLVLVLLAGCTRADAAKTPAGETKAAAATRTLALAGVVAGAALLPLFGDPNASVVSHAEWARLLLRGLDLLDPAARGLGIGWYQEPNGKIWWVELLRQ